MQFYKGIRLLLLALALLSTSAVYAADVDKTKDQNSRSAAKSGAVYAGECPSEGTGSADLDVNNVRARLYNNGNLFFADSDVYEVPKGGGVNSVFASGIWIGGMVNDELRMAAATYSHFEWRPGPLFDDGTPATNCDAYDHLWKVSKTDVEEFEASGTTTRGLREWPTGLGAPTLDANGNRVEPTSLDQVIDLAAGQRPEILGDQTIWWIMNDVAAPHDETNTRPIGLEAQVTAFAFNQAGALGNTTFYKYRFEYKGTDTMTDVWLGLWSDPDLGGAGDDYVGSDSTLGLGFVYNASPTDGGYGDRPPALGYDFFQGPLVEAPGETWTDPDGTVHENATRLGMQKFVYYNNDATSQGNPNTAEEYYGYLTGFWRDGVPITFGGTGRGFSNTPADYMYPADPPEFWSEFNFDGNGSAIQPGDRRFLQSTGPFTLQPGDVQEIVFGIVWAQDTEGGSDPHLASLQKLKRDNALAQSIFDINFELPAPPDAPRVNATELDQEVILTWDYPPTSNNYLGRYSAINPLISDVPDVTFDFEGFIVYRFDSPSDTEGEVVAVFDRVNGVTRILEETPEGLVSVDVPGTDSGLQWSMRFTNLTNYTEYHYGVQAYAFNEFSSPRTYKSPIRRVTVVPSRVGPREGGTLLAEEALGARPDTVIADQAGQGVVTAEVVDPALVTGATYRVEFYSIELSDNEGHTETFTVYDVVNENTGEVIFSGEQFLQASCRNSGNFVLEDCQAPPQEENTFVAEGLSFSIQGPAPGPLLLDPDDEETLAWMEVQGPGGSPVCEASQPFGCAEIGLDWVFHSLNSTAEYYVSNISAGPEATIGAYAPRDFEIRFTEEGSFGYSLFQDELVYQAPIEVWDIGPTGGGENDPSDDVQMILNTFSDHDTVEGQCAFDYGPDGTGETEEPTFGFPASDRVYAYYPSGSYEDWANAVAPLVAADPDNCPHLDFGEAAELVAFGRGRPLQRIVFGDFAGEGELPGPGTIVRFISTKPNLPGDVFTFNVERFAPQRGVDTVAVASLDDIGVVPNPYRGASAYETSQIVDEVRIINLPEEATIRIFTLSGTLIRTLQKNSPETFTRWDLQTENGLPIASGMYLIHIETDLGERVVKFGAVKKRVQLNEL